VIAEGAAVGLPGVCDVVLGVEEDVVLVFACTGTGTGAGSGTGAGAVVVVVAGVLVVVVVVAGGLVGDRLGTAIPGLVAEGGGSAGEGVAFERADRLGTWVGTPLPAFPAPPPQPDRASADATIITPATPATMLRSAERDVA